jgi:hypothetical protein
MELVLDFFGRHKLGNIVIDTYLIYLNALSSSTYNMEFWPFHLCI